MNLYNVLEYLHNRGEYIYGGISDLEIWSKAHELYEHFVYKGWAHMHDDMGTEYMSEYTKIRRLIVIGWIPWQDYQWVERYDYQFTGREPQIEADSPGKIPPLFLPWVKQPTQIYGLRLKIYQNAHIMYLNWLTIKHKRRLNWKKYFEGTGIEINKQNLNTCKRCGSTLLRLFIGGWVPKEDPVWFEKYVLEKK